MTTNPTIDVELSKSFLKELKRLGKRFHNVLDDVEELIEQLENGDTPGDQVKEVGFTVYKVRVKNTNTSTGKSGG